MGESVRHFWGWDSWQSRLGLGVTPVPWRRLSILRRRRRFTCNTIIGSDFPVVILDVVNGGTPRRPTGSDTACSQKVFCWSELGVMLQRLAYLCRLSSSNHKGFPCCSILDCGLYFLIFQVCATFLCVNVSDVFPGFLTPYLVVLSWFGGSVMV